MCKIFRNSSTERITPHRTHIPIKVYKYALLPSASDILILKRKFFSLYKIHKSIRTYVFLSASDILSFYNNVGDINFIPILIGIVCSLNTSAYRNLQTFFRYLFANSAFFPKVTQEMKSVSPFPSFR